MLHDESNTIDNINIPDDLIEISSLLKLNRKKVRTNMLKLLNNSFDEDCEDSKKELLEIMRYTVFLGGKYYRSFLISILGEAFDVNKQKITFTSSIIELLHSYILMQNAMPDIENEDYRNNYLTCHKKFGNTKTIIATNALISLIIENITNNPLFNNDEKCKIISIITKHNGKDGVSCGQIMKYILKKKDTHTNDEETRIRKLKFDALFNAGFECLSAFKTISETQSRAIKNYINNFCNLTAIYSSISTGQQNINELIERSKLCCEQATKSVSRIKNNKNLINFIKYIKYDIDKLINSKTISKPVLVNSDLAQA